MLQPDSCRLLVKDGNETKEVNAEALWMKSRRKLKFSEEAHSSSLKEKWQGVE